MFNLSTRPQSFQGILLDSLRLYKLTYVRLLFFSAIYTVMIILPNLVLYLTAHVKGTPYHVFYHSTAEIVAGFINFWFLSVIVHAMYQMMTKSTISVKEACRVATRKYFVYLSTGIVFAILSIIGFVLLVFPGIFIQVLMGFFIYFILFENEGIVKSLKHSAQYVWGSWWRTFAIMLVPVFVMVIFIEIINHSLSFPVGFLYDNAVEATSAYSQLIIWILLMIVVPWFISVMTCLYHDLKLRNQQGLRSED